MSERLLALLVEHAWQCALAGAVLLVAARYVPGHGARRILLAGGLIKFLLPVALTAPIGVLSMRPSGAVVGSVLPEYDAWYATPLLLLAGVGAAFMLTQMIRATLSLRRETAAATPVEGGVWHEELHAVARRLDLRTIPEMRITHAPGAGPRACGVLRPLVLLPAALIDALPRSGVRAVLMHELAHHRRGDVVLAMLANFIVALWWWHPVTWLLARSLRRAAEEACDDVVITQPDISRHDYCAALLNAARACTGSLHPAPGFADHPLRGRLRRIVAGSVPRGGRRTGFAAAVFVVLLLPGARISPVSHDAIGGDEVRLVNRSVIRTVDVRVPEPVVRIRTIERPVR